MNAKTALQAYIRKFPQIRKAVLDRILQRNATKTIAQNIKEWIKKFSIGWNLFMMNNAVDVKICGSRD